MDIIIIGYFIFLLVIYAVTSIVTRNQFLSIMLLWIFVAIGYILTILPMIAVILPAIGMVGLISYYLFLMKNEEYGI